MKELFKDLSTDKVLGGSISLLQPKKGFRVGIDSILLSSSIKKFTNCLELGSGSGVISICLASRINDSKILGVEKNKLLVEIAKRNLVNNDLSRSKINFQHFDIMGKEFSKIYNSFFDRVIMNPPYFNEAKINLSKNYNKASAKYLNASSLNDWIEIAYKKLEKKGYLNFIYRTGDLSNVLTLLDSKWGDIKIFPLWPQIQKPSKLFLIQARKDSKAETNLLPGLVLHNEDGSYTNDCNNVLLNRDLVEME